MGERPTLQSLITMAGNNFSNCLLKVWSTVFHHFLYVAFKEISFFENTSYGIDSTKKIRFLNWKAIRFLFLLVLKTAKTTEYFVCH